ncbi:MAG: MFS transporter [Bilophila wadsworthia]
MRRRLCPKEALFTPSFIAVCSANLLFFIASFMMVPVLPIYLLDGLHASKSVVGIILSAYMIGALVMRPLSGFLADQFPRKILFLVCGILFAAQFEGYLLFNALALVGIVRALHGMSFGALSTSAATLAVDVIPIAKLGTGIGLYGMMGSLAMALGPMIVCSSLRPDHTTPCSSPRWAARRAASCSACWSKAARDRQPRRKISLDRFFLKKGTYAFIGLVLMAFVYGLLVNYLSVFARERHVMANPGYFFLLMSLGLILSRLFAGGMIDKGYIGRLILGGKGTILLASLLFLFVPTETVFFGSAVAFGLGFGMMSPSYQTLFINLAEPTRRGTANATYLIAWDVGIGAAVLLGGLIAEISSFDDAFILGLIMLFFSAVLYMKVIGPQYEKNRLR